MEDNSPIAPDADRRLERADLPIGLDDVLLRSSVPITVADLKAPDCPLVFVNKEFCDMTGHEPDKMIGKNCRFLQPDGGAGPVRARIRAFLADSDAEHDRFALVNIRADGERFLNLLYLSKLSRRGTFEFVLGSQFDISNLTADRARIYDEALAMDLRKTKELFRDSAWSLIGSFTALAESSVAIARAKLND